MPDALPDTVDATATDATRRVLDAAQGDHVLALVSGGHDSLTAMHVAHHAAPWRLDGIVHVNTGIGIPETRRFVRERAHDLGLDYYEVGQPHSTATTGHEYRYPSEEYVHLVQQYGFPGPGAHKWMYLNLKEKPLQRFLTAYPVDRDDLTLVSGVRQHESDRRMETVDEDGVQEYLDAETISPLVAFRGIDVRRYRRALDLPMNPVVEKLEMSGECLCGAFANRGERRMLRLFYPDVHRYLTCLESKVSIAASFEDGPNDEYTTWGHNQLKSHEQDAMTDDNQQLLCTSCEQRQQCESTGTPGGDCS